MDKKEILKKLTELEHYAELLQSGVAVLKKELDDRGGLNSSAPRGSLSDDEIRNIKLSRKRSRMKKATKP